jgi:zinc protease
MASLTFDELLYAGHPYSRADEGWPETVQAITLEDLAEFHRKHYGPRGMVIAVVGAVEPEKAASEVERVLGGWQNEVQGDPPRLPEFSRRQSGPKSTIPSREIAVRSCHGLLWAEAQ